MPEAVLAPRDEALARFRSTPSGREKPGRFWKIDLDAVEPPAAGGSGRVAFSNVPSYAIACDLETARTAHAELLDRAIGRVAPLERKFAQLALANARLGAFVYISADRACDEPIVIEYAVDANDAVYPHTVVLAERGARISIVERVRAGGGAFVCGLTEIVTGDGANVSFTSVQLAPDDARIFSTRAARPGRDATVRWAIAELGGSVAVADVGISLEHPGAHGTIAAVFFPGGSQHVDIVSTVDHRVGDTRSETLVKSAATGAGQGRFVGTIRIAAHAQHSEASLRDDALLLSKRSHIDSVPALEIAANDVKAFHGATVGALDDEEIFYMESRGIDRVESERMIALGFFEPALDAFPSGIAAEVREALVARVVSQ